MNKQISRYYLTANAYTPRIIKMCNSVPNQQKNIVKKQMIQIRKAL